MVDSPYPATRAILSSTEGGRLLGVRVQGGHYFLRRSAGVCKILTADGPGSRLSHRPRVFRGLGCPGRALRCARVSRWYRLRWRWTRKSKKAPLLRRPTRRSPAQLRGKGSCCGRSCYCQAGNLLRRYPILPPSSQYLQSSLYSVARIRRSCVTLASRSPPGSYLSHDPEMSAAPHDRGGPRCARRSRSIPRRPTESASRNAT